jgi:hypothetical protein
VFATVAIAGPAAAPAAAPTDDITNSPAGHQAAEDDPPTGCFWAGTAPFCEQGCPDGYDEVGRGPCSNYDCCLNLYQSLCC